MKSQSYANSGKEFWLIAPNNFNNNNFVYDVIITSKNNCKVTFKNYASNYSTTINVTGGVIFRDTIQDYYDQFYSSKNELIRNAGLHVTSTDSINLILLCLAEYSSEASNILPVQAIGIRYRATCMTSSFTAGRTYFDIIATEDSTEIEIIPSKNTISGKPANNAFNIILNKGQTYYVSSYSDLSGSLIRVKNSNCKKIAVFGSNTATDVPANCRSGDILYEQLLPTEIWNKEFFSARELHRIFNIIRVYSDSNNNVVNINGVNVDTLSAGGFYEKYDSATSYIKTSKPSQVVGFITGNVCNFNDSLGDPSMFNINAVNQYIKYAKVKSVKTNQTFNFNVVDTNYINIYCKTNDTGYMFKNNLSLASYFKVSSGNPDFAYAQFVLDSLDFTLSNKNGFSALVYGFGTFNSYAYSVGSNINGITPLLSINNDVKSINDTINICFGDTAKFKLNTNVIYESFIYDFGNNTKGYKKDTNIIYQNAGKYKIRLIATKNKFCKTTKDTFYFYLNVNKKIKVSTMKDTAICYGDTITLRSTAKFGIPAKYSYNWDNNLGFGQYKKVAPLSTKIYKVLVSDGCKSGNDSAYIKVNVRKPLKIIKPNDTTLCKGKFISIQLKAEGGDSSKYNFLWSSLNDTGRVKTLLADTSKIYKVVLTDACTNKPDTMTFNLMVRKSLKVKVNSDTTICKGVFFNLNAEGQGGDSLNYKYNWNEGLGTGSNKSIVAKNSILYRVILTDNCTTIPDTSYINIKVRAPISIEKFGDTTICIGGSANLRAFGTGGDSTYKYHWLSTSVYDSIIQVNPRTTTIYKLEVKDDCTVQSDTASFIVKVKDALKVSHTKDTTICIGTSVNLNAFGKGGDSLNYKFNWMNFGNNQNITVTPDSNFKKYYVVLSDGCSDKSDTSFVTIRQFDPLKVVLNSNGFVFCKGVPVTMTVNGKGGKTSNHLFTWSDGLGIGQSKTVIPPNSQSYSVVLSDGCTVKNDTTEVKVKVRSELDVIGWIDTTICKGQYFELTPTDTGGLPLNRKFTWNHGLGEGTIKVINPDTTTVYTVILTDGCTAKPDTASAIVYVRNPLKIIGARDTTICKGQNLQINLYGEGGLVKNHYFKWQHSFEKSGSINVKPLSSEIYYASLHDDCSSKPDSVKIIINVRDSLQISFKNDTTICFGDTVYLEPITKGGLASNYKFEWLDNLGNNKILKVFPNSTKEYFSVLSDGCTKTNDTAKVKVIVQDKLHISSLKDTLICYGQSIDLKVNGKGGDSINHTFTWSNGLGNGNIKRVNPKNDQQYKVLLSDACTYFNDSLFIDVFVRQPLNIIIKPDTIICIGEEVNLNTEFYGGISSNYRIFWSNNSSTSQNNYVKILKDSIFTATLYDDCSDSITKSITVKVYPPINANFKLIDSLICINQLAEFINLSKGANIKSYKWSLDNGFTSTSLNPIQKYNQTGFKNIQLIVYSDKGCSDTILKTNFLKVKDNPISKFELNKTIFSLSSPTIITNNLSENASSFEWDFDDNSGVVFDFEPQKTYFDSGRYKIILIVKDAFGCNDTSFQNVRVLFPTDVYIPTAFSPNDDLSNNRFEVKGVGVLKYEMTIFNRWGEIVFKGNEESKGWDGKMIGQNSYVQEGVYGYYIKVTDFEKKKYYFKGTITLLR